MVGKLENEYRTLAKHETCGHSLDFNRRTDAAEDVDQVHELTLFKSVRGIGHAFGGRFGCLIWHDL